MKRMAMDATVRTTFMPISDEKTLLQLAMSSLHLAISLTPNDPIPNAAMRTR